MINAIGAGAVGVLIGLCPPKIRWQMLPAIIFIVAILAAALKQWVVRLDPIRNDDQPA